MKTNIQCPLEHFQILSLKFSSYLTKACCQSLLLVKELLYTGHLFVNRTGKTVTTLVNFLMKTSAQCPLENFRMLWLEIHI